MPVGGLFVRVVYNNMGKGKNFRLIFMFEKLMIDNSKKQSINIVARLFVHLAIVIRILFGNFSTINIL